MKIKNWRRALAAVAILLLVSFLVYERVWEFMLYLHKSGFGWVLVLAIPLLLFLVFVLLMILGGKGSDA